MAKLTKAQREWLRKLNSASGDRSYVYRSMNYAMAGRMRDLGVIEIVKEDEAYKSSWPWSNWKPVITDAGRAALSDKGEA